MNPSNTTTALTPTRASLRKTMRQRRRALSSREQKSASHGLFKLITQHKAFLSSQRIALYLAADGEISTRQVIEHAWKMGKEVYLPVIHPIIKHRMWFVRYTPQSKMQKNGFGILEPNPRFNSRIMASRLSLVGLPLVAFDKSGGRLGMGGGFYDRGFAFKKNSYSQTPALMGLAHNCQEAEKLPLAPWDIPLDSIVTDQQIIRII
jgi:5-formyltetrahydrofolate cyclo-ligase